MPPWDPDLYARFAREREQPARDLLARVNVDGVKSVVDLGCGAGASTALLRARWPAADVVGIDRSPEMLAAARKADPDGRYEPGDIAGWRPSSSIDVVFCNAALHWVPRHGDVLPRLLDAVKAGGALALQMPNLDASPVHAAAARLLRSPRFAGRLVPEPAAFPSHEPVNAYRPILAPRARAIDIWETEYRHVLPDDAAILDWYRATGLRPYLDSLATDADRADFESALLSELPRLYRERAPGSVVMPFRRFFVIAYRD